MISVDQTETEVFIVRISGEAARTLFASDNRQPRSDVLRDVINEACTMRRHLEAAYWLGSDIDDSLPF